MLARFASFWLFAEHLRDDEDDQRAKKAASSEKVNH
jgi:hypothetical protein